MSSKHSSERRGKARFTIERELRYKLLKDGTMIEFGVGQTVDIGSGGVGFMVGRELPPGSFIELSISWPAVLEDTCPMRLIVFGRVLRNGDGKCACTIEKHEFRTQSRMIRPVASRKDSMLQQWADSVRRDGAQGLKARMAMA